MRTVKGKRLTAGQADVYDALKKYGPMPDAALVPLIQHVSQSHQSSSGIRTRRSELVGLGLVTTVGEVKTATGRKATVFKAVKR